MMTMGQERFYTEYHNKVYGYIRARVNNREDAEDLCADVFEKAFRAADSYDATKAAPGTWLYTITRNTVINHLQKFRPTEELPEDLTDNALPEDGILQTELLDTLAAALEKMPDELTDIIILRYYDRLPLTEIAMTLGMSYGAVKLRHQKALSLLRKEMENY